MRKRKTGNGFDEANLAKRLALIYRRVVFATLLIFAAFLMALLAKQYFDKRSDSIKFAGDDLEERALSVDYLLSNAAEDVIESSIWAENYLSMARAGHAPTELFPPLTYDAHGRRQLERPPDIELYGNIIFMGSASEMNDELTRQINMTMRLFEVQRINHYAPPDFTWSEFYSTKGFGSIYPWVDYSQGAAILARPAALELLAQFASEPPGDESLGFFESFEWSDAYVDSSGKGLMITCASPVNDNEGFIGMTAAEMSLSFLSHFVEKPDTPSGSIIIANKEGQILAATGMAPETLLEVKILQEALPGLPVKSLERNQGEPERTSSFRAGKNYIISTRLKNADWTMIKIVPASDILKAFFPEALFGAVLIGLMFGFLTAANRVVNRYFVNPAVGFVGFIETEATTGSAPKPDVPPVWEQWFLKISDLLALKSMAANLPGAIFQMKTSADGMTVLTLASSGVDDLLGVSSEALLNRDIFSFDFLSSEDIRLFKERIVESETKKEPLEFEAMTRIQDGKERWALFILRPRKSEDPDGETVWDGLMLDISERKALEDELRRHRDELENTVDVRTEELRAANEDLRKEIQERIRSENALKVSEERLRAMSHQAIRAQDDERARLSRELHDEIGQQLAAALFQLPAIRNKDEISTDDIARIETIIRDIGGDLHRICEGLQPMTLTQFGLVPALKILLWEFMETYDIKISSSIENPDCPIDNERATAIYRVCQESVTNSIRHSGATEITVTLRREGGEIIFEAADDGRGFVPDEALNSSKLGIMGMRQRAEQCGGRLIIDAAPGRGTRVVFAFNAENDERGCQ